MDHKEVWAPKNWCFETVVLETLESPLDSKEIKPVNPKGNQPWMFTIRTDDEAGAPIFWPPDAKNWLIRKDPKAGKEWRQEEKGMTEDEMTEWHHWLKGHKYEQTLGDGEGQESLACHSQWVAKSWTWFSDWTGQSSFPSWGFLDLSLCHCNKSCLASWHLGLPNQSELVFVILLSVAWGS